MVFPQESVSVLLAAGRAWKRYVGLGPTAVLQADSSSSGCEQQNSARRPLLAECFQSSVPMFANSSPSTMEPAGKLRIFAFSSSKFDREGGARGGCASDYSRQYHESNAEMNRTITHDTRL